MYNLFSSVHSARPCSSFVGPQPSDEALSMDATPNGVEKTAKDAPWQLNFPNASATGPDGLYTFPVITRQPLAKNEDIVGAPPGGFPSPDDSLPLKWNNILLDIVRELYRTGNPSLPGPPVVARAFGVFNACMFDAWAFYSGFAVGVYFPFGSQSDKSEATEFNQQIAISFAALEAIKTLFPSQAKRAKDFLDRRSVEMGWGFKSDESPEKDVVAATASTVPINPKQVGQVAANAVLQHFAQDGSNFPSYADTTSYRPFNANNTNKIADPDRWTPVSVFVPLGGRANQDGFLLPHWGLASKRQFALDRPDEFRPSAPFIPTRNPVQYNTQIDEILESSRIIGEGGAKGDRLRAVAEYWADGPNNETAPGIHILQASFISRRDKHDLTQDILFFTILGGILQDCAITAWDAKREYDNARMITAIRILRANQTIKTWGGPGKDLVEVPASEWLPYLPTPPFADHISGHATFAGGAGSFFRSWTGNDNYGETFIFKKGTSVIEPGYPREDVTLTWRRHLDAQEENGISRLYGGIHWGKANTDGQESGSKVAEKVANFVMKKAGVDLQFFRWDEPEFVQNKKVGIAELIKQRRSDAASS